MKKTFKEIQLYVLMYFLVPLNHSQPVLYYPAFICSRCLFVVKASECLFVNSRQFCKLHSIQTIDWFVHKDSDCWRTTKGTDYMAVQCRYYWPVHDVLSMYYVAKYGVGLLYILLMYLFQLNKNLKKALIRFFYSTLWRLHIVFL